MAKFELSDQQVKACVAFLQRTTLQGAEVVAFNQLMDIFNVKSVESSVKFDEVK